MFEHAVDRTKESVEMLARVVAGVVEKQGLRPIDAAGVALLVDEAAHRAGSKGRLSLLIGDLIDVCREADHWAGSEGRNVISTADIARGLRQRATAPDKMAEVS